jgi:hypothetical protein
MMKFQRQGCILSNDYKDLSITKTPSLYIHLGSFVALSAKGEPPGGSVYQGRVVSCDPGWLCPPRESRQVIRRSEVRIRVSRDLGFGQLDLGSHASAASRNLIGPRAVRWYKASPLPGLDRNIAFCVPHCLHALRHR